MWNDSSNYKKYACYFVFIVFLILFGLSCAGGDSQKVAFAKMTDEEIEAELNDKIDGVLNDIDTNELDDFLSNDFNFDFLNKSSFKDIVLSVLNGNYFNEYDSLFDYIGQVIKNHLQQLLSIFVMFLAIVLLHEMFNNFCVDKYADLKKSVKLIFSLFIILLVAYLLKDVAESVSDVIDKIFSFSNILFPILLTLVSISGAVGTHSVYSSLSVFLLNTGSYVFKFVLMPLSISILVLSLVGSIFSNKRFEKTVNIFKWFFKCVIGLMFAIFGLFSMVNLVSVGVKDGVSLKLTKFALKNYIPVLGGYVSDGFDFVHACSVLIKNAFGVCGIIVLLFTVLKPLLFYFAYIFLFKMLSLFVSYVSNDFYSDMFDNVSKCLGYFVSVLVGVFLIMFIFIYILIVSVSVVWWFLKLWFLWLWWTWFMNW